MAPHAVTRRQPTSILIFLFISNNQDIFQVIIFVLSLKKTFEFKFTILIGRSGVSVHDKIKGLPSFGLLRGQIHKINVRLVPPRPLNIYWDELIVLVISVFALYYKRKMNRSIYNYLFKNYTFLLICAWICPSIISYS